MKKVVILAVICVILTLSACYQQGSVNATKLYEPYHIANVNVPYADKLDKSQFDKVQELEQDSYGRRYFSYRTYSTMLGENIEIHIICQKTDESWIYYYCDDCYMIRRVSDSIFTEEDIAALKNRNNWDTPLVQEAMARISYDETHRDVLPEWDFRAAVQKHLHLDDTYGILYHGMDINENNEQLFFVYVFVRQDATQGHLSGKHYLMLCQNSTSRPILKCEEVNQTLNCQEIVREFRNGLK